MLSAETVYDDERWKAVGTAVPAMGSMRVVCQIAESVRLWQGAGM